MSDIEERIKSEFNCTVPFFMKPGIFCFGSNAQKMPWKCSKMIFVLVHWSALAHAMKYLVPIFRVPKRGLKNRTRRTRLYLKSHIKVTEDFVSYGLLRSVKVKSQYQYYTSIKFWFQHGGRDWGLFRSFDWILIDGLADVAQQGSSFSIKIKKELIEIDN